MGYFWVAGQKFKVDANVVRWDEQGDGQYSAFNAYWKHCSSYGKTRSDGTCRDGIYPFSEKAHGKNRANRYSFRPGLPRTMNPPLSMVQAMVQSFVIHFDNCLNSEMCYKVLHDERGLSVHFLIDNDGTIYQTLDLAHMGFQCAGINGVSFGVELASMGDAKRYADWYTSPRFANRNRGPARGSDVVKIHGHSVLCYKYTPAQMTALKELAKGLRFAFPNLPLEYPQSSPGHQSWDFVPNFRSFKGYLGHYHTTEGKWDPGLFDFKEFCQSIRGAICYPVFTKYSDKSIKYPLVPDDTDAAEKEFRELYKKNEQEAEGGFYPVAPYGEWKLWHGGVHIPEKRKAPIFSSFSGRIMAARTSSTSGVGSNNFLLIRHDLSLGPVTMRFFAVYYHLEDEWDTEGIKDKGEPEWLANDGWKAYKAQVKAKKRSKGDIVLLDIPVEAGQLIGRVGEAGPIGARRSQFHFEIFSQEEHLNKVEKGSWKKVFGTSGGRFCDAIEIIEAIDTAPKDGAFSRREVLQYFKGNSARKSLHRYAVLHLSEWIGPLDSWKVELRNAPDFAKMKDDEFEEIIDKQIRPTLWWDAVRPNPRYDAKKPGSGKKQVMVAEWAGLPFDGVVFHYHPVSFVKFVTDKIGEAKGLETARKKTLGSKKDAKSAQEVGLKGDRDDESGASFVSAGELKSKDDRNQYDLSRLVEGFKE